MLYDSESGDLTLVACGDTMITRPISVFRENRFSALLDLFREADVGFSNLEMLMHEYEHSPGIPGGTFTASDPANLEELKWAGINLLSCANNHSYDYGEGGILTNLKNLKASGIVNAGTGRNLSEARAPGYLETAAGRVALLSATSSFPEPGRALDQRPDLQGRPGANPQRFSTSYTVDRNAFDELQRISTGLGMEANKAYARKFRYTGAVPDDTDTQFHFQGSKYLLGEEFKVSTSPQAADLEGNLRWIREARRMADWVLMSFQCHENGETREQPPEFLTTFARACIDEGADAFIGHGPHVTRGIEIYKDRPIFYSMGNFIFQNDTVRWQPSYNYDQMKLDHNATPADFYEARSEKDTRGFPGDPIFWQVFVARCGYKGRRLAEVELHPIDLGHGRSRSQRGRPMLADAELGGQVLERLQNLSEPFGTRIDVEDGRGVIRL